MEENLADGGTRHTLKDTYNYTLTFVKGKYFGSGRHRRRMVLGDIFLVDRNSDDFPALRQKWETEGKLSFKRTRHLCLEHHLWAAQTKSKSNYLYYTSSLISSLTYFAVILIISNQMTLTTLSRTIYHLFSEFVL